MNGHTSMKCGAVTVVSDHGLPIKTEAELDALNKIVTAYLDIAEVHALNQEPMYMKDWLETIDDYLKMTRRDILTTSGHVSHKQALEKAHAEYDKYKNRLEDSLSPVEKDFIESIDILESIAEKNKIKVVYPQIWESHLLVCFSAETLFVHYIPYLIIVLPILLPQSPSRA